MANAIMLPGKKEGWQTVTLTTADIPEFVDNTAVITIPHTTDRCIIGGTIQVTIHGHTHGEESRNLNMHIVTATPAQAVQVYAKRTGDTYSSEYDVRLRVSSYGYIQQISIYSSDDYYQGSWRLDATENGITLTIYRVQSSYDVALAATLYVLPI